MEKYGGAIHFHQDYPGLLSGGGDMSRGKGGKVVVETSRDESSGNTLGRGYKWGGGFIGAKRKTHQEKV